VHFIAYVTGADTPVLVNREGIARIAESLSIRAFSKRLEKLPYLLPTADFGQFGY
jgi:hypothetical protein